MSGGGLLPISAPRLFGLAPFAGCPNLVVLVLANQLVRCALPRLDSHTFRGAVSTQDTGVPAPSSATIGSTIHAGGWGPYGAEGETGGGSSNIFSAYSRTGLTGSLAGSSGVSSPPGMSVSLVQ